MHRCRHWQELDDDEREAIRRLARALRDWPRTIGLFGASGSLHVILLDHQEDTGGNIVSTADFTGIHGDGGDPGIYDGPVTRIGR